MAASIRSVRPLVSICARARVTLGYFAVLLLAIGMISCPLASAQTTTTISGTVYAPNGVDPLVNVLVYATMASVTTPVSGANCPGAGCQTASNAIPAGVTLYAYSAVDGSFTLSNIPVSTSYTLVLQAGKWQRQFLDVSVDTTALTGLQLAMPSVNGTINTGSITSSLPAAQTNGSVTTVNTIPLIAISTGSQDAMECVLRDVGIADTEFTDDITATATTGGRIHLYQGDESPGAYITTSTPNETVLMGGTSTTPLTSYDMAMFPCQGKTTAESAADIQNLIAYTSAGGRVFATHDSLVWLDTATAVSTGNYAGDTFSGAVNWLSRAGSNPANGNATINTGFTDGNTLAQWMVGVNASTTLGQVALSTLRDDISSVIAPTQSWVTLNSPSDIMQLTFNTPVGADAASQYGRVLFNEYHVEDGSSKVAFPAECGSIVAPSAMSAQEKMLEYSLFDLSNFVTAVVPPSASISITTNPVDGSFNEGDTADTITADVTNTSSTIALPANTTFSITLPTGVTATAMTDSTGGWSCTVATLTCMRSTTLAASTSDSVTVTVSVSSTATGNELLASGTVSAQVSSPNFSSNVTSPLTITLLQAAAVSWAAPAAITYGMALSSTQLDAMGNAPSGTYVYSPLAGTVLSAGSQTLSVVYTPGSSYTSNYPGTGTASVTLVVNPAMATVTLSGLAQGYTGSPVAATAMTSPSGLPVMFTYTGTNGTVYGPSSVPPTADGSYTVVATINSGQNYAGTTSGTLVIAGLASPDVTSTIVQVSPSPVMAGQPVTITATITDTTNPGTIPTGSVIFTDTTTGTTLNSGNAVVLNGYGIAVLTGVVLNGAEAHIITAAYSGVNGSIASSNNTAQVQVGLSSLIGTALGGYPVTVTITAAGTPVNISVLTEGAPNLDYTDAVAGDTCVSNPAIVGQTCTVNVIFTPRYPGPRYGAVVVTDGSGNVLGTAYLQGVGTGPQVTFANTTQGNLAPNSVAIVGGSFGFSNPSGIAIDASGDVFIADTGNHAVEKIPYTEGAYSAPITLASSFSFNSPYGVAVDGAGNVFVSDNGNREVYEILAAGGYTTVNPLGNSTSNSNPKGIAVDGAGNVYVSGSNNAVYEIPAIGGYTTAIELGGGFLNPGGVAVDAAGDIFVSDTNNSAMKEMPAGCTSSACVTQLASIGYPAGMAIDGAGDLYIVGGALTEVLAGGGYATGFSLSSSIGNAISVAVASNGNVFFTNGNAVEEFDYADAPSLPYATSTPLNEQDTTDGTETVTVTNIGNAPLTFSGVSYPGDFPEVDGVPGACSTSAQLAIGTGCMLPVNFAPTSTMGLLSESLVLTDNNLNATTTPGTQQTIALSGTALAGVAATQAIVSEVLTQNHATTPFTPITGSGGAAPLIYSVSPGLPTGLVFNTTTGVITGTPSMASTATSYTVTVTDSNGATVQASFSLTVDSAVMAAQEVVSMVLTQNHLAAGFTPVAGSGGDAPLTYSVSPGLPTGLVLNASTGAITGTPTAASAATTYTVTVTDTDGAAAQASFSLAVNSAVTATVAISMEGLTYYQTTAPFTPVTGLGGTSPLAYSVSPGLSAGLMLNASTGAISGTPTAVSAATKYTVTVTDANGETAQASFSLGVAQQASVTVVSVNPTTAMPMQAVTLNATVASTIAGTPVAPNGTVTFFDGATQLGAVVRLTGGAAQLVVPSLPPGQTAVITAVYSGDMDFLGGTSSNSASVVVSPLNFTFTDTGVSAYTAAPGAVASYSFALAPLYSIYAGPVSFTVTGLPAGAVASFTPGSVAADGGAVPVTMTVQTAAVMAHSDNHGNSAWGRGVVLALLLLPFGMKRKLREKLRGRMLLLVLLLAGMTAAVSGCGSNNGFMLQSPGTYMLTVTASSGTQQVRQTVTLIVQ